MSNIHLTLIRCDATINLFKNELYHSHAAVHLWKTASEYMCYQFFLVTHFRPIFSRRFSQVETSKNLWFYDVFRWYRKAAPVCDGLNKFDILFLVFFLCWLWASKFQLSMEYWSLEKRSSHKILFWSAAVCPKIRSWR